MRRLQADSYGHERAIHGYMARVPNRAEGNRNHKTTRLTVAKKVVVTGAVTLLGTMPAFAQTGSDEKTLSEVVVSASRSQTKLEQMPLHTTVITQEDIKKSPAQTLDQLLRNVPGMNFTGVPAALSDPTGQQTKMRGLGNAKVLVLLDGIPIHDPFYLTTQWFKVPLFNIERVEIIRGGNSSLWGNMAVAGVINIVSKRPKDNAGEAMVMFGSQHTGEAAVSKDVVLSEALSFNLAADIYRTEGYQTTPAEFLYRFPQKGTTVAENKNVQLTTFFKPSKDLNGYLRLGYHIQDQDINYQNGSNIQKSPSLAANLMKTFEDRSNLQANVWAQYVDFQKFNGNTCYYRGGTTCLTSTSSTLTPANVNNNVVQFYSQHGSQNYRELGSSVIYSKNLKGPLYSFQVGADYRRLSAGDSEQFYNTPTNPAAPQARFDSSTSGEGKQTFEGVFVQTKVAPIDALDITLSGRYDTYAISDRSNFRSIASGTTTGGDLPNATKNAFNPSIAARYDFTDQLSVRAATYKAFRAPGFNNLTRTYGTGTNTTIANPDLVPEDLRGWEFGSDYRNGRVTVGATYFLYDVKNMIATFTASGASAPQQVQLICGGSTLPNCGGSAKYYTNDQDGQAHGIELVANWKLRDNLLIDAFYTHTETYLTRRGSVVTDPLGVQLVGVPKNVASIGVTWKPSERLHTFVEARYIGAMLLDTTSNKSTIRSGQGSNTIVNASASYALSKNVDVFANVVNLFDREYTESPYAFNQPYNAVLSMPRTVKVGARMRF